MAPGIQDSKENPDRAGESSIAVGGHFWPAHQPVSVRWPRGLIEEVCVDGHCGAVEGLHQANDRAADGAQHPHWAHLRQVCLQQRDLLPPPYCSRDFLLSL